MPSKKKIVLYNPKSLFYDMPLALLAIGSMLDPEVYDVKIIDGRIEKNPLKKVKEELINALCLGVTTLTGNPLKDALKVSRMAKNEFPDLPIIWGGWHASLFPVQTLYDESSVDITVQGQGEITFRNLVYGLDAGASLESVQGITYRNGKGDVVKNQPRSMVDMNELPRVNYDLVDIEAYFSAKNRRQFDYISSTGCHFRCTFCADPFVYERKWTGIAPERMGKELKHWHEKYNFDDINFQDETFFTKRKRVTEIAQQLLTLGIKTTWAGTLRADQGSRMSMDEYDLCKESGLRRVLVGVESGSQEMMDWLSKDIKLEQVLQVAEICAEKDIDVIFPFIVGFPKETDQSVIDSLNLAHQLNKMHKGFTTPIFYFKPYPGSKITDDMVAGGYQLPSNIEEWAEFDYIGSSGPWVEQNKYRLVESFKFYNKIAGRNNRWVFLPLEWVSKIRCNNLHFKFPLVQHIYNLFFKTEKLS